MTQLQAGDEAPKFELKDANGDRWRLEDRLGKKVVVYFYPIDDTPGCTREACDFRDAYDHFQSAGVEVVGISPQDAESHSAFIAKHSLNFPLLVDSDLQAAKAFGAVEEDAGSDGSLALPSRSTFVIDEEGRIEQALYGARSKGHVEQLKNTLQIV